MTISYQAIADRAVVIVGSADPVQHQAAFDTMAAETTTTMADALWESELSIMSRLGVTAADTILSKIETAVGSDRVTRMIRSAKGVNLADPQTIGLINSLVAASVLSQAEADALLSVNQIVTPVWPGLQLGHVQNALELRQRGDI